MTLAGQVIMVLMQTMLLQKIARSAPSAQPTSRSYYLELKSDPPPFSPSLCMRGHSVWMSGWCNIEKEEKEYIFYKSIISGMKWETRQGCDWTELAFYYTSVSKDNN